MSLKSTESSVVSLLDAKRILQSAGSTLLSQAALHGELAAVEWAEEKNRLLRMLLVTLLGFACLICCMLSVGALVLAGFWGTAYRIPALVALVCVYAFGTRIAWRRLMALSALSGQSFAATRDELSASMDLFRALLGKSS